MRRLRKSHGQASRRQVEDPVEDRSGKSGAPCVPITRLNGKPAKERDLIPCGIRALAIRLERIEEQAMAKSDRKGNKEIRKPKKAGPPKRNASNPSTKGIQPPQKS